MFVYSRSRKPFIVSLAVSMLVLTLAIGTQYALANKVIHPIGHETIPNSPPESGDDGMTEVAVEWINIHSRARSGVHNGTSCNGFYGALQDSGWSGRFNHFGNLAWAIDFKRGENGGLENFYPDSVDIAMVCSQGDYAYDELYNKYLSSVYFHRLSSLSPGEAKDSYGDKDLEWLAFDVPLLLGKGILYYHWDFRDYWASTGEGLHLLLGFRTPRYSSYIGNGSLWAEYMLGFQSCFIHRTVMQSRIQKQDDLHPGDVSASVLADVPPNFDDHLFGKGYVSPDPGFNWYYYPMNHCSTGPASKGLLDSYDQPEVLSMPIVRVLDRVVDEDYVRNIIAPAFGFEDEDLCDLGDLYSMSRLVDGVSHTLQVDQVTGSFSYHNLSSLWTTPEITPTLPSADLSDVLINAWFHDTPAINLPAANYRNAGFEYMTEDIETRLLQPGVNGIFQGQEISDLPVDVSMTYPRLLTVSAHTTNGTQQVDFPVLGPGGRMKVYLGDQGEIIGAQGGSRDVQVMGDIVDILDSDLVWSMYLENPSLAIGEIGIISDTITHTVPTLGYYEMPYIVPQDDLIPVWEFRGWFYSGGNLVAENVPIYLPAAAEYMPPQVAILSPDDGSIFWTGESISFEGSITGGTPPYTVEWSSAKNGILGTTINLITTLTSPIREGIIYTDEVSFEVIDANGLSQTATISLKINPIFWIPLINR